MLSRKSIRGDLNTEALDECFQSSEPLVFNKGLKPASFSKSDLDKEWIRQLSGAVEPNQSPWFVRDESVHQTIVVGKMYRVFEHPILVVQSNAKRQLTVTNQPSFLPTFRPFVGLLRPVLVNQKHEFRLFCV